MEPLTMRQETVTGDTMRIRVDTQNYPLEAILNASYAFLDRAYIFLSSDLRRRTIDISFTPKEPLKSKDLKVLRGEFTNELLHAALRFFVSQRSKAVREYIVNRALFSVLPPPPALKKDARTYQDDPEGIAIPWEEKYGKKKKARRS